MRLLALREGSIIVITVVTAIYFSTNTSSFFTGENFETLLPYFAPFAILAAGEVFVMILGEIDLSIAGLYLFAPILFYKLNTSLGVPLVPAVIVSHGAWLAAVHAHPPPASTVSETGPPAAPIDWLADDRENVHSGTGAPAAVCESV